MIPASDTALQEHQEMPPAQTVEPVESLPVRVVRALRLGTVARALLNVTPRRFRQRMLTRLDRARVRRSYSVALVPADEFEQCCGRALDLLKEKVDGEQIGDYLEFGVCHGTSMLCMHRALGAASVTSMRLFGFDSFEGLPESAATDDGGLWKPGQFNSDYDYTRARLEQAGVDWDRTFLIQGWFSDSLTEEMRREHALERVSIIMVDCDMYLSAKEALSFCAPLIQDHAVVMFDDWGAFAGRLAEHHQGERRAFEEFMRENAHLTAEELPSYHDRAKVFLVSADQSAR